MHAATVEVDRGWPRRSGELAEKGRTDGLIIGDQNGLSLGRLGTHKFIPSVFVHDMSKMRVCFRTFMNVSTYHLFALLHSIITVTPALQYSPALFRCPLGVVVFRLLPSLIVILL